MRLARWTWIPPSLAVVAFLAGRAWVASHDGPGTGDGAGARAADGLRGPPDDSTPLEPCGAPGKAPGPGAAEDACATPLRGLEPAPPDFRASRAGTRAGTLDRAPVPAPARERATEARRLGLALSSGDASTRIEAIRALARLGGPGAGVLLARSAANVRTTVGEREEIRRALAALRREHGPRVLDRTDPAVDGPGGM